MPLPTHSSKKKRREILFFLKRNYSKQVLTLTFHRLHGKDGWEEYEAFNRQTQWNRQRVQENGRASARIVAAEGGRDYERQTGVKISNMCLCVHACECVFAYLFIFLSSLSVFRLRLIGSELVALSHAPRRTHTIAYFTPLNAYLSKYNFN